MSNVKNKVAWATCARSTTKQKLPDKQREVIEQHAAATWLSHPARTTRTTAFPAPACDRQPSRQMVSKARTAKGL